jgi:hypothetical protein
MTLSPPSPGESLSGVAPPWAAALESWPHRCGLHPLSPAIACCMRCGRKLCDRCRRLDPSHALTALCPSCASPQTQTPDASPSSPAASPGRRRAGAPLSPPTANKADPQEPTHLRQWPRTLQRLFTAPGRFFTGLRADGGLLQAVGFGLFWSCFPALLGVTLFGLINTQPHPILRLLYAIQQANDLGGPAPFVVVLPLILVLTAAAQVFVYGGLYHGLLYAMGVRPERMLLTFKIVAYALAGQAFLLIPGEEIPAILARILTTSLLMIGLRQAYQTTFLKAALVIAIPMLLNMHVGFDAWILVPPEE